MRGLLLCLLLITGLTGDSGWDTQQLQFNAQHSDSPQALLWRAVQLGDTDAASSLVEVAEARAEAYWLAQLVALGNADAAWALYQLDEADTQAPSMMRMAAKGNVPEAQFSYAMATDDMQKRVFWLEKAAQNDFLPAQIALADWHMLNQNWAAAKPLLLNAAEQDIHSAYELARLLLFENQVTEAQKWLAQAAAAGNQTAQQLNKLLANNQPMAAQQISAVDWPQGAVCQQRIMLVGTSFFAWQHAKQLKQQFSQDDRLAGLGICLSTPQWVSAEALACRAEPRIICQLNGFKQPVREHNITHLVVVTERGKANVDRGVMYLALASDYAVFVHELAHFAGFADEYPMPAAQAHIVCSQLTAPNLIITGELTYEPVARLNDWQALHANVPIAPARTCDKIAVPAYKPTRRMTFLEHHDTEYIPPLYLALWKQQIDKGGLPTIVDNLR